MSSLHQQPLPPLDALGAEYRQRFEDAVARAVKDAKKPVLLLSGGDSIANLVALPTDALARLTIVTATFGEHDSVDSRVATERHRLYCPAVPFSVFRVPRDPIRVGQTVDWFIRQTESASKSAVEVMVAVKPLLESLAQAGHDVVLNGMPSGCLWGCTKEDLFNRMKNGDASWTEYRLRGLLDELDYYPPVANRLCHELCKGLGMQWVDPGIDLPLVEWMLRRSYTELHKGRKYAMLYRAFPIVAKMPFQSIAWQVGAGVREWMQMEAERKGHSSALAWYNEEARRLGFNPLKGTPTAKARWTKLIPANVAPLRELGARLGIDLTPLD